jgi:hypothetical protein
VSEHSNARDEARFDHSGGAPLWSLLGDQMQSVPPEAMEHLLNAAHELIAAARVVLDAADQVVESQRESLRHGHAAREPRLRRIDID